MVQEQHLWKGLVEYTADVDEMMRALVGLHDGGETVLPPIEEKEAQQDSANSFQAG